MLPPAKNDRSNALCIAAVLIYYHRFKIRMLCLVHYPPDRAFFLRIEEKLQNCNEIVMQ